MNQNTQHVPRLPVSRRSGLAACKRLRRNLKDEMQTRRKIYVSDYLWALRETQRDLMYLRANKLREFFPAEGR